MVPSKPPRRPRLVSENVCRDIAGMMTGARVSESFAQELARRGEAYLRGLIAQAVAARAVEAEERWAEGRKGWPSLRADHLPPAAPPLREA